MSPSTAPGQAAPRLDGNLDFMRSLWLLDQALLGVSNSMAANLGVTAPQRLAIKVMARFPEAPASQIAEILCLHPSTVSGIVRRLEKHGLVRRRPNPSDRRSITLQLTRAGKRIESKSEGTVENAVQRLRGDVPVNDLATATEVLERLAALLNMEAARPRRRTPKERRA